MPKRIQRRRTKGWRLPPNTVIVSRPTKWGNPYRATSPTCLEDFRCRVEFLLRENPQYLAPLACHADILIELANL
jgi:hypothetical protein